MRRRDISRTSQKWLAAENALDRIPDPEDLTDADNLRVIAAMDELQEALTRHAIALEIRIWLDEHRDSVAHHSSRRAS